VWPIGWRIAFLGDLYREQNLARYELTDQRKYGSTLLCFYQLRTPS
jgi:hypothetical protein